MLIQSYLCDPLSISATPPTLRQGRVRQSQKTSSKHSLFLPKRTTTRSSGTSRINPRSAPQLSSVMPLVPLFDHRNTNFIFVASLHSVYAHLSARCSAVIAFTLCPTKRRSFDYRYRFTSAKWAGQRHNLTFKRSAFSVAGFIRGHLRARLIPR